MVVRKSTVYALLKDNEKFTKIVKQADITILNLIRKNGTADSLLKQQKIQIELKKELIDSLNKNEQIFLEKEKLYQNTISLQDKKNGLLDKQIKKKERGIKWRNRAIIALPIIFLGIEWLR